MRCDARAPFRIRLAPPPRSATSDRDSTRPGRSDARTHYSEALRIGRENALDGAVATALLNLGNLASSDGDYAQASKCYLEALTVNRNLGNAADAALALHNLGLLALRTGDYRAA